MQDAHFPAAEKRRAAKQVRRKDFLDPGFAMYWRCVVLHLLESLVVLELIYQAISLLSYDILMWLSAMQIIDCI